MPRSKEILNLAVSIGEVMLESGGEIYRVQETVGHVLEAYGIRDYHVFVITNGMVRYVPIGEVNLQRVAAANQLSREISAGECKIEEAYEKLLACRKDKGLPKWLLILSGGVGCAGFGYLMGARPYDSFFSFFLGMFLEAFLILAAHYKTSKFITNILGSALITAGSLVFYAAGAGILYDRVIIGGIMPLLPGVSLTTAIRDLFGGDYLSGAIRLTDALLTSMCIAIGVGAAVKAFQMLGGGVLPL